MPATKSPTVRRFAAGAVSIAATSALTMGGSPAHAKTWSAAPGVKFTITVTDNGNGTATQKVRNTAQVPFKYMVGVHRVPDPSVNTISDINQVLAPGATTTRVLKLDPGTWYVAWWVKQGSSFTWRNTGEPFTMGAPKLKQKPQQAGPNKLGPDLKNKPPQQAPMAPKPGNPKPGTPNPKPQPAPPGGIDWGSLKF